MTQESWNGVRYQRQTSLPGFGTTSQKKLSEASVLVVGAGGLGCPAALYLVGAGIGRLGIMDEDQVDLSNLQRQILYGTKELGQKKVIVAGQRLRELNPETELLIMEERLTRHNAEEIVGNWDLVLDGTDNFQTRYLLHDICYFLHKPYIYGSVYRFEGQAGVFCLPDEPCFRCVFPEPPPPESRPNCSESGVLGPIPGMVGSVQALEAIKILAGIRARQKTRLLIFDGLHTDFRHFNLSKNPDCPLCGTKPTIQTIEQAGFIAETPGPEEGAIPSGDFAKLKRSGSWIIIDVRDYSEFEAFSLGGVNVPLKKLEESVSKLLISKNDPVLLICAKGGRSYQGMKILQKHGYSSVKWVQGGVESCRMLIR